jgi:hypothetical protein
LKIAAKRLKGIAGQIAERVLHSVQVTDPDAVPHEEQPGFFFVDKPKPVRFSSN